VTDRNLHPPSASVAEVVARALAEDLLPMGDLTAALIDENAAGDAALVARERGVLAGAACVEETYRQLGGAVKVSWRVGEGGAFGAGDVLGELCGPLATVLTGERTALNFLRHLSGVASLTRQFVSVARGRITVLDTRKTTPGLRALEKAAVRAGGGRNHRASLSDAVLIKDNHLGGISIEEAVSRAKRMWPGRMVEVECDRIDQVRIAVGAGATMVLLDNMSPDDVRACVREVAGRCLVEVSGNITLDNVGSYADTGADYVSSGALTHSAPQIDIGLDLDMGATA
jgi:nicotinate-nucleotide pyrophosphorylase (carboxylating)